jgi:hypothetical protein
MQRPLNVKCSVIHYSAVGIFMMTCLTAWNVDGFKTNCMSCVLQLNLCRWRMVYTSFKYPVLLKTKKCLWIGCRKI